MVFLYDPGIGWQLVNSNLVNRTIPGDQKSYRWWLLRRMFRTEDIKTGIKPHEFGWYGVANNSFQEDAIYPQRSKAEFTRFALPRKHGEIVYRDLGSSNYPGTRPERPFLRSFGIPRTSKERSKFVDRGSKSVK